MCLDLNLSWFGKTPFQLGSNDNNKSVNIKYEHNNYTYKTISKTPFRKTHPGEAKNNTAM